MKILQQIRVPAVLVSVFIVLSGCSLLTTPQPSASELTADGWEYFSNGYYRSALESFNEALNTKSGYSPAMLGKGWTHLMRKEMNEAENQFRDLSEITDTIAVMYVGLGAIHLYFGTNYNVAVQNFNRALALDSTFQFRYKEDIDFHDVRCMKAMAHYYLGDFPSVQQEINILLHDSSIPVNLFPDDPDSWVVEDVRYDTYQEALLRVIQILIDIHGTGYFI